jgi:hypothetical protein
VGVDSWESVRSSVGIKHLCLAIFRGHVIGYR